MAIIDQFLRDMLDKGGSDLHLCIGQPVKYRVHGNIIPASEDILTPEFMEEMLKEICLPADRWRTQKTSCMKRFRCRKSTKPL